MPVLAATFTTAIVFFPVVFLYGVSRFLFTALAAAVVFSLFASYAVAMTVVPLFCARFLKSSHHHTPSEELPVMVEQPKRRISFGEWFNVWFNDRFESFLKFYDTLVAVTLRRPVVTLVAFVTFYLNGVQAFQTELQAIAEGWDSKSKAVPIRLSIPLESLKPGSYDCQVTVLDPSGQKAAFWRAPVVLVP